MALARQCLHSTVRNISGGTLTFSFLPPHGQTLENGEEMSFFGNILEAVQRRSTSKTRVNGFLAAVAPSDTSDPDDALLQILQTPNPILYDHYRDHEKMLSLHNGTLVVADPCWDSDSGD